MSKIKFRFSLNIEDALREQIESISFEGLGADAASSYEVSDVGVDDEGGGSYEVTVDLDRTEGKFVSNDDLEAEITSNLGELNITIDYL